MVEGKADLEKEDAQRRALGEELLGMLPGDWRSRIVIFHAVGIYAGVSREDAVVMIFDAFVRVCSHIIPVPALNKWLSLLPAMSDLARGCSIHALTRDTLLVMGGAVGMDVDGNSEDEDQGAAVGLPDDEMKHFRAREQRRQSKIVDWMSDQFTHATLLLWLVLGTVVLQLHYVMFRDAKCSFAMPHAEGPLPNADRAAASVVFNLCNPKKSRARQVKRKHSYEFHHGGVRTSSDIQRNYWYRC